MLSLWAWLDNYFLIFSSAEKTKGLSLVGDRRPWQGNCLEWEEKEFHHWRKASLDSEHTPGLTHNSTKIFLLTWKVILLLEMIFRKCYHIWGPLECPLMCLAQSRVLQICTLRHSISKYNSYYPVSTYCHIKFRLNPNVYFITKDKHTSFYIRRTRFLL